MTEMREVALDIAIIAPATLLAVEVFLRCRLLDHVGRLKDMALRSLRVVTANRVSDHWKERVLPVYALAILRCSFILLFSLGAILAVFLLMYCLAGALVEEDFSLLEALSRTAPQVFAVAIGLTYGVLRTRCGHG